MSIDIPTHIGIIMDGNGRWALQRGHDKKHGYTEGLKSAKRSVKAAIDKGVRYLTFYTFSTENWNRPKEEVDFLFEMIATHLKAERLFYKKYGVRVVHSGSLNKLPQKVVEEVLSVQQETQSHSTIVVNLAINYGGRDEIIRAVHKWHQESSSNPLTIEKMHEYLDVSFVPDPDLIIRTGGECRLSNFLVWECAYAELYFTNILWPEWKERDMKKAINEFGIRKRNFGGARA